MVEPFRATCADVSHLSSSASKEQQDDTARKVLLLLQVKDAEIRRLEADAAELRNEKNSLGAEMRALRTEAAAQESHYKQMLTARDADASDAGALRLDLEFARHECDELVSEKSILLSKARKEMEHSETVRNDLQQERASRLVLEHRAEELEVEVESHKELAANLLQMVELHKEEGRDRHLEVEEVRRGEAAKREALQAQLEQREGEVAALRAEVDAERRRTADAKAEAQRAAGNAAQLQEAVTAEQARSKATQQAERDLEAKIAKLESAQREASSAARLQEEDMLHKRESIEELSADVSTFRTQMHDVAQALKAAEAETARLQAESDRLRYQQQQAALESQSYAEELETVKQQLLDTASALQRADHEAHELKSKEKAQAAALSEVTSVLKVMEVEQEHLLNEAARVSSLEYDVKDLQKHLEAAQGEAKFHESAAAMNQESVMSLHQQLQEHEQHARSSVAALEKRLAAAVREVETKQHTIDAAHTANEAAEIALQSERDTVSLLHQRVADIDMELETSRAQTEKYRKALRQVKEDNRSAVAHQATLQRDVNHLSRRGVESLQEHQQIISSLATDKEALEARLLEAEARIEELDIESTVRQRSAESTHTDHTQQVAKLEGQLRACKKEAEQFASECASLLRERDMAQASHEQAEKLSKQLAQDKAEVSKTLASHKRLLALAEGKARTAEKRLETAQQTELDRLKDKEASARRSREDDRRRHEVMHELRNDKQRLTRAVAELKDELRSAEERNKALQSQSARASKAITELRSKAGPSRRDDPQEFRDWQGFVLEQVCAVVAFLVRSIATTIEEVQALRAEKGDILDLPHLEFEETASLYDTSTLTTDHFAQQVRLALGFPDKPGKDPAQCALAQVPQAKFSGGLRNSRKTQDLASLLKLLIRRRTRLESDKASYTAA